MSRRLTLEEKAAKKIVTVVNDLTLDLDMVGFYVAREMNVSYNRLREVVEAAEYERESRNYGLNNYTLF